MEKVFAVILGLAALWCLWSAFQVYRTSSRQAAGFALAAVSAVVQVLNILKTLGGDYSLVISIITTIGLLGGFWLTRAPTSAAPHA